MATQPLTDRNRATRGTRQSASTADEADSDGFTEDERAAMRERVRELRAAGRRSARRAEADGESDVLDKISEMPEADRAMATRLHALITVTAPLLSPRTWYGMPAYAKHGSVVCFFKGAYKFKTRYATLGFSDKANLDDGSMWPSEFALTELTTLNEQRIVELIKKAVN